MTHLGDDSLFRRLLEGVEGGYALEEGILSLRVVFLEDASPHPEPVTFVRGVVG